MLWLKKAPSYHWLQSSEIVTGQALRTRSKKGQVLNKCSTDSRLLQKRQPEGVCMWKFNILSLVSSLFFSAVQRVNEHLFMENSFHTVLYQGGWPPLCRKLFQMVEIDTWLDWNPSQVIESLEFIETSIILVRISLTFRWLEDGKCQIPSCWKSLIKVVSELSLWFPHKFCRPNLVQSRTK